MHKLQLRTSQNNLNLPIDYRTLTDLRSCTNLAMVYLKTACVISYFIFSWFGMCHACVENEFAIFQEKVLMKTLKGHRLARNGAEVSDHDVFTQLQCLDICLRTERCASVDVKETYPTKICRINRAPKTRKRLLEDESWSHLSMSTRDLGMVSLRILRLF